MKALKWVLGILVIAGLAAGGYIVWERFSRVESTDDAQIDGSIFPLSPRVAGHVIKVAVQDQAAVKADEVLVQLDPQDFEIALDKARAGLADAEATLASARSDIPVLSVSTASTLSGARSSRQDAAAQVSGAEQALGAAKARLKTTEANVRVAEAKANKAAQDVERYKTLVARDDIPRQQYEQAVAEAEAARANVDAQNAAVTEAQQNILAAEKNIEQARAFCRQFFQWYNHSHRHSGIGLMTPAAVHHGQAEKLHAERQRVLDAAYAATPERFVRRPPTPPELPTAAWINKPTEETAH